MITTIEMTRTLESSGFSSVQSHALVEIWELSTEQREDRLVRLLRENFVTKEEFHLEFTGLRLEIERRFGQVEKEISGLRKDLEAKIDSSYKELQSEIGSLRKDLENGLASLRKDFQAEFAQSRLESDVRLGKFENNLVKLFYASLLSQAAIVLGAVVYLVNHGSH